MKVLELWLFKVLLLALKVKFDLRGQRSFEEKEYICNHLRDMRDYSFVLASEVKFDIGGQSSYGQKVAHLI